jgi:hypothetical protein
MISYLKLYNESSEIGTQSKYFFLYHHDQNCLALFLNLLNGTLIKIVLHNLLFSGLKIKKVYFLFTPSKNRIKIVLLSLYSFQKPDQTSFPLSSFRKLDKNSYSFFTFFTETGSNYFSIILFPESK